MARKRGLLRKIFASRLWWVVFILLIVCGGWLAWRAVPQTVITHEMMGKLNDEQEVRLLFVGDMGSGEPAQQKVADQMEQLCATANPTGIVFLGDNFYYTGVESIHDPLWETRFERVYSGECLKKQTFYSILGNHDYRGVTDAQIEYTRAGSGRWAMPARFYSLRFRDILEIGAADSTMADLCGFPGLCMGDWLIEKLKSSQAKWKIMIGHHPILSGGKYRSLRGVRHFTLPEIFCRSGASVYISGHDHGLQHLHGQYPTAKCKVEQFVSGGGGASLNPIEVLDGKTLFAAESHGVLLGRFTPQEQRYEFFKTGEGEPAYVWSKVQGQ